MVRQFVYLNNYCEIGSVTKLFADYASKNES